jgi:hypothetical protein
MLLENIYSTGVIHDDSHLQSSYFNSTSNRIVRLLSEPTFTSIDIQNMVAHIVCSFQEGVSKGGSKLGLAYWQRAPNGMVPVAKKASYMA